MPLQCYHVKIQGVFSFSIVLQLLVSRDVLPIYFLVIYTRGFGTFGLAASIHYEHGHLHFKHMVHEASCDDKN